MVLKTVIFLFSNVGEVGKKMWAIWCATPYFYLKKNKTIIYV